MECSPGPRLPAFRLRSVVLDCPDPPALASFYAQLLGAEVHDLGGEAKTFGGFGNRAVGNGGTANPHAGGEIDHVFRKIVE